MGAGEGANAVLRDGHLAGLFLVYKKRIEDGTLSKDQKDSSVGGALGFSGYLASFSSDENNGFVYFMTCVCVPACVCTCMPWLKVL